MLEKGANPNVINDDKKTRNVAVLRSRHNKDKPYDQIFNHYGF
ncbi:putative ankyrin domain protein ank12 [Wolbachia endosymbiont of Trichogramma pretiosum]|nr:putative ankyrin domain protein ank12 [Wolbachia endosymbiont of Trichogramma pretiosum]